MLHIALLPPLGSQGMGHQTTVGAPREGRARQGYIYAAVSEEQLV